MLDRLRGMRAQTLDAQDPRNREDLARFLNRRMQSPNLAALRTAAHLSSAAAIAWLEEIAVRGDTGQFFD